MLSCMSSHTMNTFHTTNTVLYYRKITQYPFVRPRLLKKIYESIYRKRYIYLFFVKFNSQIIMSTYEEDKRVCYCPEMVGN